MSEPSDSHVFETATCSAPAERAARMRAVVVEFVPHDRSIEVLDVGCGTGSLIFQLAEALPLASFAGVDISPANIRVAERQRAAHPAGSRIRFEHRDYLESALGPVDAIVTDTALHFIRGRPERLWTKLAADLRPSSVLVCCMAYDGAYNRAIRGLRRMLRAARSAPIDFAVQTAGRLVYGRALDGDRLKERTEYMYIPPEQLMTESVKNRLAPSLGLDAIAERTVPSASVTQLRQRITVFVKR